VDPVALAARQLGGVAAGEMAGPESLEGAPGATAPLGLANAPPGERQLDVGEHATVGEVGGLQRDRDASGTFHRARGRR
jgi:hypothetical protein